MTAIVETKTQRRRRSYRRNKKIRRAKTLSVVYTVSDPTDTRYYTHGERTHVVILRGDGKIICDCHNGQSPCSHVIAVRMFRREWK